MKYSYANIESVHHVVVIITCECTKLINDVVPMQTFSLNSNGNNSLKRTDLLLLNIAFMYSYIVVWKFLILIASILLPTYKYTISLDMHPGYVLLLMVLYGMNGICVYWRKCRNEISVYLFHIVTPPPPPFPPQTPQRMCA